MVSSQVSQPGGRPHPACRGVTHAPPQQSAAPGHIRACPSQCLCMPAPPVLDPVTHTPTQPPCPTSLPLRRGPGSEDSTFVKSHHTVQGSGQSVTFFTYRIIRALTQVSLSRRRVLTNQETLIKVTLSMEHLQRAGHSRTFHMGH